MIEKVVEGVGWIAGRDKFLPDSHVYVIGNTESDDLTLVDCGLMDMGSYKLEAIENSGIPLKKIKRVIMTHTHIDHIGCLPEILESLPELEVWVHEHEASYLERGDERIVYGSKMFESMIRTYHSIPKNAFKIKVHRKLKGGESLNLGGLEFQVLSLPGHSVGSIGLYSKQHLMLLSGDTIYADGAIGRYDLHSASAVDLKRSLALIAQMDIDILLPCHNRIVKSGATEMVRKTVQQWTPLLGH